MSYRLYRPSFLARTWTARRSYASQTPGTPIWEVFNRKAKHEQKDRAARNVEESRKVDYIKDEVAMRLCERLLVSFTIQPTNPFKYGLIMTTRT